MTVINSLRAWLQLCFAIRSFHCHRINSPETALHSAQLGKRAIARSLAVDPGNNQICLLGDATVTVVDGACNATTLLNLNSGSGGALLAAVNLVTHRVYVSIECTSDVTCRYPTPGMVAVIEAAH